MARATQSFPLPESKTATQLRNSPILSNTFRLCVSSFFLIFTGLSSSSSKLTVDATLESALEMLVEFMTFAAFGTAPISMVEFGVARDIAPFVRSMGFD